LSIDEDTAVLLASMSAATIGRRLVGERAKYQLKGRVGTKPGSLLKSQIPVRTWAEWDDAQPGFVEIELVWHDRGIRAAGHAFTLTVADIAAGWTENRSVPDKTGKCELAALDDIARKMPFPILGVDSDNGSEFISDHLLGWRQGRQKIWTVVRCRAIRTTAVTSSRKSGPWCAPLSPTTATTPPQNYCHSTSLAVAVPADPTTSTPSRN
jgi:hypothetical protein